MEKEQYKSRMEEIVYAGLRIVGYSTVPLMAFMAWVVLVPLLLWGGMMTSVDDAKNIQQTVIIFSLPMVLFFAIVPVAVQRLRKIDFKDLGLKIKKYKRTFILLALNLITVVVVFVKVFSGRGAGAEECIAMMIQLTAIGIAEETLSRGIIYFEILNVFKSKAVAIIVSSLIFAFLFHSGDGDINNLLIRVPLGLVLALVRCYTGNLYNSIAMHVWYNSLMLIL